MSNEVADEANWWCYSGVSDCKSLKSTGSSCESTTVLNNLHTAHYLHAALNKKHRQTGLVVLQNY